MIGADTGLWIMPVQYERIAWAGGNAQIISETFARFVYSPGYAALADLSIAARQRGETAILKSPLCAAGVERVGERSKTG